jgi:hypothetical protein
MVEEAPPLEGAAAAAVAVDRALADRRLVEMDLRRE